MARARTVLMPLGLVVIGVLALLTALSSDEVDYSAATFTRMAEAVESDFEANNDRAEGAPQQQVAAAWASKDALQVVILQAEDTNLRLAEIREAASRDAERTQRLIMLAVLAVCWLGIWLPFGREPDPGSKRVDEEPAPAAEPSLT